MELTIALGFFGALLMGFVLGVLGGGGAILTIPILVYLFGFDLRSAVVSSYAILFFSSIVGGIQSRKEIEWRLALLFAAVSMVFITLTKFFVLPNLPKEFLLFGLKISTQSILLLMFVTIMFIVAYKLLNPKKAKGKGLVSLALNAAIVGVLGSLIGVGGGFLIVPAIYAYRNTTMSAAIASTFVVITLNSASGLAVSYSELNTLNFSILFPFLGLAVMGVIAGTLLSKKWSDAILRKSFVVLLLAVGTYMLTKEIIEIL
jgi:uncharacterized membrane protein YfcA